MAHGWHTVFKERYQRGWFLGHRFPHLKWGPKIYTRCTVIVFSLYNLSSDSYGDKFYPQRHEKDILRPLLPIWIHSIHDSIHTRWFHPYIHDESIHTRLIRAQRQGSESRLILLRFLDPLIWSIDSMIHWLHHPWIPLTPWFDPLIRVCLDS